MTETLSLCNGSRCLDALSRFICPRHRRRRRRRSRRRDSSARSKGEQKFSPTTVHQNSISPFSTVSTSVWRGGKVLERSLEVASKQRDPGWLIGAGSFAAHSYHDTEDGKIWAGWNKKIHPRFRCKWKSRQLLNTFSWWCVVGAANTTLRCPITFSFKKSSTFQRFLDDSCYREKISFSFSSRQKTVQKTQHSHLGNFIDRWSQHRNII